ncbi:MAG: FHA domain-containing protein [Leptolyngbyaceae cyanobacterium bins.349]|nr:FHA domain-containing protein [Leptolyngbyaceae cyanobacterium bins.349]
MIVCPNCNHQNPEGAVQCESCYTPLPATISCPNCGASVQTDASFCGQCGFSLKAAFSPPPLPDVPVAVSPPLASSVPDVAPMQPPVAANDRSSEFQPPLAPPPIEPDPLVVEEAVAPAIAVEVPAASAPAMEATAPDITPTGGGKPEGHTQLQQQTARLLHTQTNTTLELPQNLTVIHMGKPNDRIPPDIDVSGFPNSEIVSRIHADIRIEGDAYYIEDVGSSNGTYINNLPLPMGNRHRLRPGDRISLGKGDKVTFLFQLS